MNGYVPLAPFFSTSHIHAGTTLREREIADARGWGDDLDRDLLRGSVCTCVPGAYECNLHMLHRFERNAMAAAERARILACGGAAL